LAELLLGSGEDFARSNLKFGEEWIVVRRQSGTKQ
jgi:hypothetical protein